MLAKRVLCVFIFIFFVGLSSYGQIPAIKASLNAQEKPIKLVSLETSVRIYGYLAETSMTMKFVNPNRRTLEGELYFPLPESGVLTGYALDIDGDMVDGVAVEKQKAREVFEKEVRKGVDPGIVEKVKGNNFKTRIYPLLSNKPRTIRVTFTTELKENDQDAIYGLPLKLSKNVENFFLRIEVIESPGKPRVTIEGLKASEFEPLASGWFTELKAVGSEISSEIKVTIPQNSTEKIMVEKGSDGKYYFCIQGVERAPSFGSRQKPANHIVLFYDASDSGKNRDKKAESAFLTKLFNSELVAEQVTVSVVPFRNKLNASTKVVLSRGESEKLMEKLDGIPFDGASSFSALSGHGLKRPDFYLLLSDGINTFGRSIVPEFNAPVLAVTSSAGSDYEFMSAIAAKSGGKLLNLKELNAVEAVKLAGAPFWGIVEKMIGNGLSEVFPSGAQRVNGRYSLIGRIDSEEASIEASFGNRTAISSTRKFSVAKKKSVKGDFIRKLWAGKKIQELLAAKDKNRREIIKLSSKHGIVTEFTSLIVLERIDQYVEHRIVPPATKPEWRKSYFEVLEADDAQEQKTREKNIENILAMWENRLKWWETDFSKVDMSILKSKNEGFSAPGRVLDAANEIGADSDSFDGSAPQVESIQTIPRPRSSSGGNSRSVHPPMRSVESRAPQESLSLKDEAAPKKRNGGSQSNKPVNPGVAIKAWQPDAAYAKKISKAENKFAEYLQQKKEYGTAPSFFLDCSDVFMDAKMHDLAIQVLTNLSELELENPALLRILAHRLAQLDELEASSIIFAEVLEMKKEEPQSYRDLALVLGRLGKYEKAIALLYEVVQKNWDSRFPEIEVIALEELNNLIVKAKKAGIEKFNVDERLVKPIDIDLRIVMTWDADMTDMDLWVMEPSGEKAYYSNPRTRIGGLVSRDFTRGYGPEEYMIRKAKTGSYEIKTNFFGSTTQKIAGAVTLQVDIFTNYGRDDEKRRSVTLRLKENKETFTVAEVEF